jgi:hypothetical protein
MGRLKLNFMDNNPKQPNFNPIEAIMHEYGQEIYDYAKGYFNYIVATTSFEDDIRAASLYIVAPEIDCNYKILEVSYIDVENVLLRFFTLKTNQTEANNISIKDNWDLVHAKISQLLSTKLANETFRFLIDQIHLKREAREE